MIIHKTTLNQQNFQNCTPNERKWWKLLKEKNERLMPADSGHGRDYVRRNKARLFNKEKLHWGFGPESPVPGGGEVAAFTLGQHSTCITRREANTATQRCLPLPQPKFTTATSASPLLTTQSLPLPPSVYLTGVQFSKYLSVTIWGFPGVEG